jgi:hypothetical protein
MKYDVLIVCAEKHLRNLDYVVSGVRKNIKEPARKIFCVTPEIPAKKIKGVKYLRDADVIDFDMSGCHFSNPNWVKQQYIKFFQKITLEKYLVVDADFIINKPISLIENGKTNLFVWEKFNYRIFHSYIEKMFGLKKVTDYSFISEIVFFDRVLISELILSKFGSINEFILESNRQITSRCRLSEYETYGTYVMSKYPEKFKLNKTSRIFLKEYNNRQRIQPFISLTI